MAESHLAATYNTSDYKVFDNHTYVICGDGCLQEGVSGEASSLAGHLGLGKIIVLYDDNDITIDGATTLSFTEDVQKRYEAYGWHVQQVTDVVTQLDDLRTAIQKAQQTTDKPSMIAIKTKIGYGSPSKEGTHGAHGAPLGKEDLAGTKENYGLPKDKMFYVSQEVQTVFDDAAAKNNTVVEEWNALYAKYTAAHPDKAAEIERRMAGTLPEGFTDKFPKFTIGVDKDLATRQMSQKCLDGLCPTMPELMGGSADLTPSNLTHFDGAVDYQKATPEGRYIRFGVREHAMGALCNGLFAYGGFRPYCATFLNFAGYMMGAIRLSALSRFGILYVFTHDSIGLGEDGPTHQPIETLENLRSMPNINVFRPADSNEMNAAYQVALAKKETPTAICCSRSKVPAFYGSSVEKACKGGYVAVDVEDCALILVSTGSEVGACIKAAEQLTASGTPTRVVSMPCQELFVEQSKEYQISVLPGNIPTLSVEAAAVHGWHRFSHAQIGMTTFGSSGPGDKVFEYFGFSAENVEAKGKALVDYYKTNGPVPNLANRPVFENGHAGH
jgi:transketolase